MEQDQPSKAVKLVNLTNLDRGGSIFMLVGSSMGRTLNIYQAKTRLSEMVSRAADGEEFVIAKARKPRARLVPLASNPRRRVPGGGKGKVWVADDFDAPLPAELLAAFEGHDLALESYGVATLWR